MMKIIGQVKAIVKIYIIFMNPKLRVGKEEENDNDNEENGEHDEDYDDENYRGKAIK